VKVFYICLELPSESEKYFGFVNWRVFRHCAHYKMRWLRHLELFVATPASQNALNLDGISHSNVLGAFEVCLNYQAIQKTNLVSWLTNLWACASTEIAMFPSLFVTRSSRPASQKHAEFRHNFLFKRRRSIRSLFRIPSDSKDQFGFVAGELSELEHTVENR